MRVEELTHDLTWEKKNGKSYLVYQTDEQTRIFLSEHDLYLLIDIMREKNGTSYY